MGKAGVVWWGRIEGLGGVECVGWSKVEWGWVSGSRGVGWGEMG